MEFRVDGERMDQECKEILLDIQKSLDLLHVKFDKLEMRIDRIEEKFDRLENRFDQFEGRFDLR